MADLEEVTLSLINTDGSPAPNWTHLSTPPELGTLSVGDTCEVRLAFSLTTAQISEGIYSFKLRITNNYPITDVNLYVSVT